jgi:hypothetical protein
MDAVRGRRGEGIVAAGVAAALMIAHQVGSRATRDALFLSAFDVTALPLAVMASALVSLTWVALGGPLFVRWGPERMVPLGFAVSAVLHAVEWAVAARSPRVAAVVVFLHIAVFGIYLISTFWSLITERYDPRTARRRVGRIAAGGSLGGLLGGFAVERLGTLLSLPSLLLFLGGLHVAAAVAAVAFLRASPVHPHAAKPHEEDDLRYGVSVLRNTPYLRHLAWLTLGGALAAALLDYAFKAGSVAAFQGDRLLRFFALYYTAVNMGTFVTQAAFSKLFLEKAGLARTVAALPLSVFALGLPAAFVPIPGFLTAVRGTEAVLRNSIYRSAYELHYTPVPRSRKRAAKSLIDVGCERIGDGLGGAMVQLALWLSPMALGRLLPGLAALLSLGLLFLVPRLASGYVRSLEEGLLRRGSDLDLGDDASRQSLFLTVSRLNIEPAMLAEMQRSLVAPQGPARAVQPAQDPRARRLADLRSRDPARIRAALAEPAPEDPAWVRAVTRLLAWDVVAEDAGRALVRGGSGLAPSLSDALLDPEVDLTVRRRIPRVLAEIGGDVAARSLWRGLSDRRFEVRLQSGRALARLVAAGSAPPIPEAQVFRIVLREVEVDRRVWEGRRLLAARDEPQDSLFVDEVLKARADRSLEHVFVLLSLALPREPLRVAFRGLHTGDRILRGTALEYLESVLPSDVRVRLWPFIEERGTPARAARPREEILESLLASNESIQIQLAELRKRLGTAAERSGD